MSAHVGAVSDIKALVGKIFTQPKGDLATQLNNRFTVAILSISAGLLLSSHYWGDPITCWISAEFTPVWSNFVHQYCYVEGTYFKKLQKDYFANGYNDEDREGHAINYYQWVPYMLAIQAIAFSLPSFVWGLLAKFAGYDINKCIKLVDYVWKQSDSDNFQERLNLLELKAAKFVWDGIRLSRRKNRGQMIFYYNIYTVIQSMNALLMFYWLNDVIDSPLYSFNGPSVIADILSGKSWKDTGHFPRITLCNVPKRTASSSTTVIETFNCVLTLNIYYEKLMLFLWFWMFFVSLVSIINSGNWLMNSINPRRLQNKLKACLNVHQDFESAHLNKFFRSLDSDGVFILNQVALNIGDLPASYLAISLYSHVMEFDDEKRRLIEKGAQDV